MSATISQEAIEANERLLRRRKEVKITIDAPIVPAPVTPTVDMMEAVKSLQATGIKAKEFVDGIREQIAKLAEKKCETHGCVKRIDFRRTIVASREKETLTVIYDQCPACQAKQQGFNNWMVRAGIALEFFNATLDNWTPRSAEEKAILEKVHDFKNKLTGFCLMLGNKGTGKTHLAVGLIVYLKSGLILTQADLLYRLRRSYGNSQGENIIEKCKAAKLLVIDEIGLSVGGKDELPMLHEILNHRHTNFKPTVLIGNIAPAELEAVIGERMIDRITQNLAYELIFRGETIRKNRRTEYSQDANNFRR